MNDDYLDEVMFLAEMQPQVVVLTQASEDFGTLLRGMKGVLLPDGNKRRYDTYTEYTIVIDFLPFIEHNIKLHRKEYDDNRAVQKYPFSDVAGWLTQDYKRHKKYGWTRWDDEKRYRSMFDGRFHPKPFMDVIK